MEPVLTVDEIARRLEVGDAVVLDVRDGDAFAAAHVPGSWSVSLADLPSRLRDPDDPLRKRLFDGTRGRRPEIALVGCLDSGDTDRCSVAIAMLAEVGATVGARLDGVRSWSASGRPLNRAFGGRPAPATTDQPSVGT